MTGILLIQAISAKCEDEDMRKTQMFYKNKYTSLFCCRILAVIVLSLCAVCFFSFYVLAAGTDAVKAEAAGSICEDIKLTDDYYAEDGFSSQMPILVLEFPDVGAEEQNDFFMASTVLSFAGEQTNILDKSPVLVQTAAVRNMTDRTNSTSEKHDYFLRFDEAQKLIGDTAGKEYILLGAMHDKSLIRNYVGYSIAAAMMEDQFNFQLCEVFLRNRKGDLYQGVYLLAEMPHRDNAVLFHRNTGGEQIMIDTYSTMNDPSAGYISIPFIEATQWDDRFNDPIGSFSTAESVLYSTDSRTFYTYSDWFDMPSFFASLMVGELTENYAGMMDAYYYYNIDKKNISAAPIWNFDLAFDNQADEPVVSDQMQYDEAPYYEHFFKSPQFARQVQREYLKLRNGSLNERSLNRLVDEAAAYVAPAADRDWSRWDNYSSYQLKPLTEIELDDDTVKPVVPFSRQTDTYEAELLRLKHTLREHNLQIAREFTGFDFNEREISKEIVLNTNPVWPVLFMIVFFMLVRFARRYGV